jgi:hypothetical protein
LPLLFEFFLLDLVAGGDTDEQDEAEDMDETDDKGVLDVDEDVMIRSLFGETEVDDEFEEDDCFLMASVVRLFVIPRPVK